MTQDGAVFDILLSGCHDRNAMPFCKYLLINFYVQKDCGARMKRLGLDNNK